MKIIGVDYEDGACTAVDITTDGKDRIKFVPVKKAKWIKTGKISVRCSACNYLPAENDYNYCPNCGAKMED